MNLLTTVPYWEVLAVITILQIWPCNYCEFSNNGVVFVVNDQPSA